MLRTRRKEPKTTNDVRQSRFDPQAKNLAQAEFMETHWV